MHCDVCGRNRDSRPVPNAESAVQMCDECEEEFNESEAEVEATEQEVFWPDDFTVGDATVLHYTHQHDGGNGYLPHGIALCVIERFGKDTKEFVTWRVWKDIERDNKWYAETGHYFQNDVVEAALDYAIRIGRKVEVYEHN